MSDKKMRFNMIMGMIDKVTSPVQKVTNHTQRMADQIKGSQQELKRLGAMSKDIEHFQALKQSVSQTDTALDQARTRADQLAKTMNATANPTRKMTAEFNKATTEVRKLKAQQQAERLELQRVKGSLNEAGVSTRKLNDATRNIREQTERYNRKLDQQQKALGRVSDQQKKLNKLQDKTRDMRMDVAVDTAKVGASMYAVTKLVNAYGEITSAQGEIGSLGISAEGIDVITRKAKEFSNTWSGTAQEDFIKASYDIKSGISSLGDEAVGEFTRIAALTGGATKSSTEEMTSLFASGYGIYRRQFERFGADVIEGWDALSAEERDIRFGEYFSAGIASSVRAFKTDGQNMSAAISNLGATATSANIGFSEQLSILGQLQATMSGSEAATKYRAFLTNAAKAGDKLGLSFLDAENNLRSMPDILQELRNSYGDTIDAVEEKELKDAFGTDEAIALIKLLYPEIDTLKSNISGMDQSLKGGMATTNEMAESILLGPAESLDRFNSRIHNLTAAIGKLFTPALIGIVDSVGAAAIFIADLTERFPFLSQVIAFTVVGLIGLKAAFLAGRLAMLLHAETMLMVSKVTSFFTLTNMRSNAVLMMTRVRAMAAVGGLLMLSGAQKAMAAGTAVMTAAQWALNGAMLANPLTWIIAGIMALIAVVVLVIKYWEPLGQFFSGLWSRITGAFSGGFGIIKALFAWSPLGLLILFWGPITDFFGGLWDGVKNLFAGAMDWITNAVLAPIQKVKEMLGGVWDSLFGGGSDPAVDVTQKVHQVTEAAAIPAASVTTVAGVPANTASGALTVKHEYGDIIVQAAPGMSAQDVAIEVRKQLDQRQRDAEQKARGRLYD